MTKTNEIVTREQYIEMFASLHEAIEFENGALNVGREFLPDFAIAVLDRTDTDPPAAYWAWLAEQVQEMRQEDEENAAAPGEITATASNPRPSTCLPDRPGAVDVEVALSLAGVTSPLIGEVTLAPGRDGGLESYGDSPDHWISGELVRRMHEMLSDDDFREACRVLRSAAADVAA